MIYFQKSAYLVILQMGYVAQEDPLVMNMR